MSDFKSNEYSKLLGGEEFEPKEENPMVSFYNVNTRSAGEALHATLMRSIARDLL
jgi:pyruvate,water dikinase